MFILPPPPKSSLYYPSTSTGLYYRDGNTNVLEATNSSNQLEPDDVQAFTAPEGTYKPKETVHLATPLPHPSDPPPAVVNPLAPTHTLPSNHSSGVRLSTLILQDFGDPILNNNSNNGAGANGKFKNARQLSSSSAKSLGGWTSSLFSQRKNSSTTATAPTVFEDEEPSTSVNNNNANNGAGSYQTSSSSTTNNNILSTSAPPGASAFGNPLSRKDTNASTMSTQFSSSVTSSGSSGGGPPPPVSRPKNSLVKNNSSFISRTLIHDNSAKRLAERRPFDLFAWINVGRSFAWIDFSPASQSVRHEPLTKVLFTKAHPLCHDVNSVTKSPHCIDTVVGTSAGDTIWIEGMSSRYNRINKNGDVSRSGVTAISWLPGSENLFLTGHANGTLVIFDKERDDGGLFPNGTQSSENDADNSTEVFRVIRSLSNPDNFPPSDQKQQQKVNPLAVYKVSNSPITALAFYGHTVAVTSKDGYLRLLDLGNEILTDIFPSYYGGFLCATFSPDGRYLVTGGEDDMVCIWHVGDPTKPKTLVARGQGHTSWVRSVRFDPWESDEITYRIGSVGEDGKILLWDFSPKSLNRPKTAAQVSQQNPGELVGGNHTVLHPFVSQSETPMIPPVVSKLVHLKGSDSEALSDLRFLEKGIAASGKDGRIWLWDRPSTAPETEQQQQ